MSYITANFFTDKNKTKALYGLADDCQEAYRNSKSNYLPRGTIEVENNFANENNPNLIINYVEDEEKRLLEYLKYLDKFLRSPEAGGIKQKFNKICVLWSTSTADYFKNIHEWLGRNQIKDINSSKILNLLDNVINTGSGKGESEPDRYSTSGSFISRLLSQEKFSEKQVDLKNICTLIQSNNLTGSTSMPVPQVKDIFYKDTLEESDIAALHATWDGNRDGRYGAQAQCGKLVVLDDDEKPKLRIAPEIPLKAFMQWLGLQTN